MIIVYSSSIVQVTNVLNRTIIVLCRNVDVTDRHSSLSKCPSACRHRRRDRSPFTYSCLNCAKRWLTTMYYFFFRAGCTAAACCAVFNSVAACSFLMVSTNSKVLGWCLRKSFAEPRVPFLDIIIGALLVLPIDVPNAHCILHG